MKLTRLCSIRAAMYFPTRDEFLKLAAQGNLIPVARRLLADFETPLSAYRKIRGQGESFLFESVEGGEHLGRYSFVGCNPRAIIRQTGSRVELIENGKVVEQFLVSHEPQSGHEEKRILSGDMKQFGKVEELTFSSEHQTEATLVRDGLEVVERV